jgi:hypothetical protein
MREPLKSCPFCGGRALFYIAGTDDDKHDANFGGRYIACEKCDASTRLIFPLKDEVDSQLRELWNARVGRSTERTSYLLRLIARMDLYWDGRHCQVPMPLFGELKDVLRKSCTEDCDA